MASEVPVVNRVRMGVSCAFANRVGVTYAWLSNSGTD